MATRTFLREPLAARPFLDGIGCLLIAYRGGHRQGRAGTVALRFQDELAESHLELAYRLAIDRAAHLTTRAAGVAQTPPPPPPQGARKHAPTEHGHPAPCARGAVPPRSEA